MTTARLIDTQRIKQGVDLVALASRYTTLRKWSGQEMAGPCPRPSCTARTDGFHVNDGGFCCYTCHPKWGDAIEFVLWLGIVADFKAACQYLGGPEIRQLSSPARRVPMGDKTPGWPDPQWQSDARAALERAQACLASPTGDPGAEYLRSRGILPDTWQAWGLGFDPAKYDPATNRRRPAIVIPWQRDRITAVKYRFTDSTGTHDRFVQKGGGEQIVFGLNMAGQHWSTLWLVEGELNALSIWQALRSKGRIDFDVVSFGGDSKADKLDPDIRSWAARYQRVIVWADSDKNPDATADIMQAIPGAFGLRSPHHGGVKLDANAFLQTGALADYVLMACQRFDQRSASR